mmetsp:Transcript_41636/g.120783  ORF Transcript_41636/g.120783 Transcript_41636/m.120783 type:complete len:499 (+) Transcript_41636:119-1615(+)
MPSVSRGAIWTVYLVMLMDTLNFGIVFPLIPSIAREFGASATVASSMATTYSFCQMVATPVLGRISDRLGRRPVLLLSLLGTVLSSLGTGLAWDFSLLVAARCINGISGGTVGVVNAYIADVTTREEKPIYMSYVSVANAVGIIIGPAVGGLLSKQGFSVACYVSAGLSTLNLLAALPTLKESRWQQARDMSQSLRSGEGGPGVEGDGQPSSRTLGDSGRARIPFAAYFLFVSSFFLILGFAAMESVVSYYLMDRFYDGDAKKAGQIYGLMFTFVGIVMIFFGGVVYKPARKFFGEQPLLYVGAVIRTGGFMLQAWAPTPELFAMAVMVCVAGNQFIFPTTSSLLTTMCHRSIYGWALGCQQALQALSHVIGPSVFGWGYDHMTHEFSFYACAATSVAATICIFFAFVFRPDASHSPSAPEVMENAGAFEDRHDANLERGGDIASTQSSLVRSNSADSAKFMERAAAEAAARRGNQAPRSAGATEEGSDEFSTPCGGS